ncbi:hypothetical protein QL093DRAFT_2570104 [Fusarium oxysporum]|nr:hypothetical protein QL093DRAFT_2570104 [Fusarium oxysporum]
MIKIGRPLPPKSNTNPRPSKRRKTTPIHPSHEPHHPSTSPSLTPVVNDIPSSSSPPPSPSKPAKSPKPAPQTFTEVDSLRKQAEPYRLAVAELPIHLLDFSWSRGSNRPLDRNHVAHLCRSFQNGGLARRAEQHYIQVSCSAAAVQKMIINALPDTNQSHIQDRRQYVLSFRNWADFIDERPELMAGQHRIEALKDYVKQTHSDSSDLWWICEFYDKDTLPVELDIKLRVNRRDLTLPDTHGQIWLQLVSAFDRDPTLFSVERNVNKKGIEKSMLDILCLTSEARFPISRLVTLWRSERWRPRVTRWCRTSLGRTTFNISKWYQIAGYRLDDYWFDAFYQVLETLRALPTSTSESIQISDWNVLAGSLKSDTYDAADVHQVFYPKGGGNSNDDSKSSPSAPSTIKPVQKTARRSGFLSSLDKEAYDGLCRHLQQNLTLRFPDVQPLLKIKKEEGEVMAQVIDHVVRWVNTQPADIVDTHENNKPLRRQDLIPAIEGLMVTTHGDDWWARRREDGDVDGADDMASWLDLRSRTLERQVLDYVRSHMTEFRDPSTKHYLDLMPEEHDEHYAERFSTGDLWTGLFHIVQHALGPAFRPVWENSISERVGADNAIHQPRSEMRHRPPASAITRAICSQLGNIPEVKENPALRGVYASNELGAYIDHAVLSWASDRCRKAVENNESDEGHPWSSEALRAIQAAYQGYEGILAGMTSATAISEHDDQQQQQRQLPSLLPPEERISHASNEVLCQQQGAVSSNHHIIIKQPPSSQGFVPINTADRAQRDSGRTRAIAMEEGLLPRMQQQKQQRQKSRHPEQQPLSLPPPPLTDNATTAISSLPPAQGTAMMRSHRHRDGTQGRIIPIMPCLGLPEEVEFDVHSDGPDIDDGEDQEEARELISPFLADEHYLEEPASIQGSIVSTEDATDQFQRGWRVDRRAGDSWMYADEFIDETNDEAFDGTRALDLLQRRVVLDYGSKKTGSKPASEDDDYYPVFRLDFVSIVGLPRRPICRPSHFFDNITISFRHWSAPYVAKHAQGIDFDLSGRTFRVATGATREAWFIVMHPNQRTAGANNPRRRHDATHTRTALVQGRALMLASYIKDIFLRGELLGEGVEPRWALGGKETQMIAFDKWVIFQTLFMDGWTGFLERFSAQDDTFWTDHQPAFHAYDYGANINIEVNEGIANLEEETVIRPAYLDGLDDEFDESDDGYDGESNSVPATQQGWGEIGGEEREDELDELCDQPTVEVEDNDSLFVSERVDDVASPIPPILSPGRIIDAEYRDIDGEVDANGPNGDEERERRFLEWMNESENTDIGQDNGTQLQDQEHQYDGQDNSQQQPLSPDTDGNDDVHPRQAPDISPASLPPSSASIPATEDQREHDAFHVSYALAVDVHCTAENTYPGTEGRVSRPVCLLADRNRVAGEFYGSNYTFYPLGFHPAYGNFTSDRPPAFLDNDLFTVMKENMSHQNQGADVLSFGFFQGYSNLKRSIRHGPHDLLASHGLATAALTIPSTEAQRTARLKDKQQRLLAQVRGRLTPDNPGASTPFARERQRVEAAMQANEFAFRFEQVISIDAPRLVRRRRNFSSVLQPIFQLMRLFLKEKQLYAGILRRFNPDIFPGVMVAFARVMEAAIAEMDRRFREAGSKGLGMALSEGVAALDRLGNFCFTGDPRVLPTKVMRLLGTMDSLKTCGWPFISPRMLDIRDGQGLVNLVGWPQLSNGRPVLMHVASLEYHYDRTVASNRHSQLWFAELGGRSIDGMDRMTTFLHEVFQDLWIPETVAFIARQVRRGLNRGIRSGGRSDVGEHGDADTGNEESAQAMIALEAWEARDSPFKTSNFEKLSAEVLKFDDRLMMNESKIVLKTRRDFAEEIFVALMEGGRKGHLGVESVAPTHSTWPSILRAAIQHTRGSFATRAQWVSGIAAAMVSASIEWVPGSHRRRLTHQQVVQLVGAAASATVLAARPDSLKRRALEAEARRTVDSVGVKRAKIRPRIDLGCKIPATPEVRPNTKGFSVTAKRRDPALLAANMVTRMLWFLRPEAFPWDKDQDTVLRVSEMTKKIEHKGVNNRMLRELGWIKVKGNRDSPRNCESRLTPKDELFKLRNDLMFLMKEPRTFIGSVYPENEYHKSK